MSHESIRTAVQLILPECILIGTVCVMFLTGPFLLGRNGQASPGLRHRWGALALLAIGAAAWQWWHTTPVAAIDGPFLSDGLSFTIRGIVLALGAVLVLAAWNQLDDRTSAECNACLLALLAGVNLTAAANDIITLFLGLELVSIPTYLLLYLPTRSRPAQEATIKYFLLSLFSSAMLVYGLALLYGATGTTMLPEIVELLKATSLTESPLLLIAAPLIAAGLGFRITAVPFHFYAPDVFQGVPAFMAALLSFIPKVVGFTALWRLTALTSRAAAESADAVSTYMASVLAVLAVLTMFIGNLMALRQSNLHRLLAYSSVAHGGYMLVGLLAGGGSSGVPGGAALLFYLAAYGFMTIGAFCILLAARRSGDSIRTIDELAGLGSSQPLAALVLSVFLFSLAGLPPTAGFLGKFNLFLAAWSSGVSGTRWLAVILAMNAAISAWYYLRLIGVMYLQSPQPSTADAPTRNLPAWIATAVCVAGTLGLFLVPQAVWDAALLATQ
ncbi:MAG: NADH-quinone oxidoreductase subunit N [Planctomyces sp.]|nr:NADH-quinone oxidoreductase subunit N [Planctomyces sp.]